MLLDSQNESQPDELTTDPQLFSPVASSRWLNSSQKRLFDLAIAAPALFVSTPLLAVIALGVKLTSRGPVVFRQERVGKGHQPFTIYKFRTMVAADGLGGSTVTTRGDSRLTTFGKILRRLKLDELPQLYNVVRGEMSLVGPRPKLMAHERMNLVCRPGITGMATLAFVHEEDILGGIHEDNVEQYMIQVLNPIKARLDGHYAENVTFLMDLQILANTVFRLGSRRIMDQLPTITEQIFNKTIETEKQNKLNAERGRKFPPVGAPVQTKPSLVTARAGVSSIFDSEAV